MKVGSRVEITVGVFKGELGTIRVVDANDTFLITFDKPELDASLREIHFARNEIKLHI